MLGSVLGSGHLEHVGDTEERLPSVSVGDDLEDGEVLQHGIHHIFLWETLEFEDEVDHIFTHWTAVDLVKITTSFKSGVLRLHLLHHLLPEAAHLGGALNGHTLIALVPVMKCFICNEFHIEMLLSVMKVCKVSNGMFYGQ